MYKDEQVLKPIFPFRSKTWAGRSPELAGILYVEFRAVRISADFDACVSWFPTFYTFPGEFRASRKVGAVSGPRDAPRLSEFPPRNKWMQEKILAKSRKPWIVH